MEKKELNNDFLVKQNFKIAVEKLLVCSGLIALGHGLLIKDGSLFSGALFLEAGSITALLCSKKVLKEFKTNQKKLINK